MKPHRSSLSAIVLLILLAAGAVGVVLMRQEDEVRPTKLPEDLSLAVKSAVAADKDPQLEDFYRAAGYASVWTQRRDEAVAALMGAGARGLKQQDYLSGMGPATVGVDQEIALAKGLMRYTHDVRFGHMNPGIYGKPEPARLGELLAEIAHDPGGVEAGLRKLDPPFAAYQRLEQALVQSRQHAESDVAALEEVRQMEQTMERWRWLPRTFPHGAILVNIPEFRLQALDETNQVALDMRVIVGQTFHQTPLFTANLKYLVFGPYWNVPASILVKEIIPDIVKDRTYLARNDYEVLDSEGRVVSTGAVSDEVLAGLRARELSVRQVPGPKNALGRVKFMFPNANDVYMHDTPTRSLFAKEQRAFSHGCVRVENPEALAEWVLRGEPLWTKQRIKDGLKQTKPLQVNLKESIPVLMVYHTVTVGDDGAVHVWRDLYRKVTTAEPGQHPLE